MKKSEYVKNLRTLINSRLNLELEEKTLSDVISIVEELGMLPASFYYNDAGYANSIEAVNEHDMYGSFRWEDE